MRERQGMAEADFARRCGWGNMSDVDIAYHDTRWCKPVHDEQELFAMLCLEGMQAGLSWSLILLREQKIRAAFDGLDPQIVAGYGSEKVSELLANPDIIRNRRKVEAAISNARQFLQVEKEAGSFDAYIWSFTGGLVVMNHPKALEDIPAQSELSAAVSADLKRRGFKFVGPTIIYSYLQAIGVINDHLESCPFK